METNQPSTDTPITHRRFSHEEAVAIMKRLVADKRQAEEDMTESPLAQAAIAELKKENERRGTPVIRL